MNLPIPEVRVGEPQMCGAVAVFPLSTGLPLFHGNSSDYVLASEAMAAGTLTIQEVSEEGSVGDLLAENSGDQPVFILEGEEMEGAKQNRVLASSVLIAGKSRIRIPVCCVQRGRWGYSSSRQFSSGSCCPPTVRRILKQGDDTAPGRYGCQDAVWREIRRKHRATATCSEAENMSDTLEVHRETVEDLRCNLLYPANASGIAVTIGGKIVGIDLFDQPTTLAKLWDRLLQGIALDALESCDNERQPDGSDISVKLYKAKVMRWKQVEPVVGLGEAYRARDNDQTLATALVLNDSVVHLSMSMPSIS
jgi:hypothetical protein